MDKKTPISCGRCTRSKRTLDKFGSKNVPCSEKCNCYLTRALIELKKKLAEQSKVLNEFAASEKGVKCNVKLTPSEEKLFGVGNVKEDSMVCCVLVRELRAQKYDLENMMARWLEFVDKADRFALVTTEISDKLAELTPRIETILHETKVLEVIELENEENRRREIDEELQRSLERRRIIQETVDRFAETVARHHLEHLARREKLDALECDRSMDREALKLALARMMKAMGSETTADSKEKTETFGVASTSRASPKFIDTSATRTRPDLRNALPDQSDVHDHLTGEKINFHKRECPCTGKFCERTIAGRPF